MLKVTYPINDVSGHTEQKGFGAMHINNDTLFIGEIIHCKNEHYSEDESPYEIDKIGSYGCIYEIDEGLSRLDLQVVFAMNTRTEFYKVDIKNDRVFSQENIIIDGKRYDIYKGEIKAEEVWGRGEWDGIWTTGRYNDGDVYYSGQRTNDTISTHGKGYFIRSNTFYNDLSSDKKNGLGIYENNKFIYEGNWDNDLFHGYGTLYYKNRKRIKFTGLFERGFPSEGKLYDKTGKIVFEGSFEDYYYYLGDYDGEQDFLGYQNTMQSTYDDFEPYED